MARLPGAAPGDHESEENADDDVCLVETKGERVKRQRLARQAKVALKWSLSDPDLERYRNVSGRDVNFHLAKTNSELAHADKVAAHWKYLEEQNFFATA